MCEARRRSTLADSRRSRRFLATPPITAERGRAREGASARGGSALAAYLPRPVFLFVEPNDAQSIINHVALWNFHAERSLSAARGFLKFQLIFLQR